MMNIKQIFFGCILVLCITACEFLLFEDLDNVAQKDVRLEVFSTLRIEDCFDVYLSQDSIYGLSVIAPVEFLENIKYRFNKDTLILTDQNELKVHINYVRPSVIVRAPDFKRVEVLSASDVNTVGTLTQESFLLYTTQHAGIIDLDLNVNRFRLLAGATRNLGEFFIRGKAHSAFFWMRSYTRLDASGFEVDQINIRNNSVSDCFVYALDSLSVGITSIGNVYYRGEPRKVFLKYQNASGQLLPINDSDFDFQ